MDIPLVDQTKTEEQSIDYFIEIKKVVLIDIDNCPNELANILKNMKLYTRIIICYGGQIPKIPLNLIYSFAEAINDKKLDVIGMTKKGKNAADFGLCFLAGRLSLEMPTAEFLIVSNDTDLDHAVNMLTHFGHKAQRIGTKQESTDESGLVVATTAILNNSDSTALVATSLPQIVAEYVQKTLSNSHARPSKSSTLLNSIKAFCRTKYPDKETQVFNYMKINGLIKVLASGAIQYTN
ncbi:MAG: hypothetical protein RL368_1113 [Pseudomonadota bacterium]|jgi:hypothetical protein